MESNSNLFFCLASRRPVMIFGTGEEADRFILGNREAPGETGEVPLRSFYCPDCGGWHVAAVPAAGQEPEEAGGGVVSGQHVEEEPARKAIRGSFVSTMNTRLSYATNLMSIGRVDAAERRLVRFLRTIRRCRAGNPGWEKGADLEERAGAHLGQIARFRETFGNREAEKEVIDSDPEDRMERVFWLMVYNSVLVREIERRFSEADGLLEQGCWKAAAEEADGIGDLVGLVRGPGIKLLRPSLEERLAALKERVKTRQGEEREMLSRSAMAIERARKLMSAGRAAEAEPELEGVLFELNLLGTDGSAWPRTAMLREKAEAYLGMIAKLDATLGNPEAEAAAMDTPSGTEADALFRRMVSNSVFIRETERLLAEAEELVGQERGKEAGEKAEEARATIERIEGACTKRIRSELDDRLSRLERDVDELLGEDGMAEMGSRKLLVRAIDLAMLADRAGKDGNEVPCRNFANEAKRLLSMVPSCEERTMVESFLSALGA